MMVEPRHLDQLLHPMFENEKAYQRDVITKGLGASPGAAVGKLVFTAGVLRLSLVALGSASDSFVIRFCCGL
jgi:phosphoenolpyruvate synthase/pyruvate phosphate dikinase